MVINPPIDELIAKVDSKYTLVIVASKRARQINDMLHGVRDQALTSLSINKIASYTSAKPLTMALEEINSGDVSYERLEGEGF
jgi:DNA-directed RNA polymerase subunit omega